MEASWPSPAGPLPPPKPLWRRLVRTTIFVTGSAALALVLWLATVWGIWAYKDSKCPPAAEVNASDNHGEFMYGCPPDYSRWITTE